MQRLGHAMATVNVGVRSAGLTGPLEEFDAERPRLRGRQQPASATRLKSAGEELLRAAWLTSMEGGIHG